MRSRAVEKEKIFPEARNEAESLISRFEQRYNSKSSILLRALQLFVFVT
jgi:hypothetical protein